jgi:hypothetical protein
VLPDGRVIVVPGFHDSWIQAHQGLAPGAKNTADFVKKTGWVSAVLHEEGFLELIVRSRTEKRVLDCVRGIVEENAKTLEKLVILVLGEDGCIVLGGEDILNPEKLAAKLG